MKLKSLLLGSAAAMIAVSGARAADAVIAEPEPMEYVKVCDMYGAGFFYIPGTETCMAFSGYVRTDFEYNDFDTNVPATRRRLDGTVERAEEFFSWDYRARFNIDVRNETDWGTLRSQLRFQGDGDGGGDASVGVDRALISLAGFRTGYSDSFTTTFHGYGLPIEKNDGFYGYDQAIFFDYTYTANGFSVGAGLQRSVSDAAASSLLPPGTNGLDLDYYAGVKYAGSWGDVAASYIYEGDAEEGAYKLSATVKVIDNLTLRAFWVADDNGATRQVSGNGDYAWGVGARYKITDTFSVSAVYSERDSDGATVTEFAAAPAAAGTTITRARNFTDFIAVGAQWDPVPGLSFRPEAVFRNNDDHSYNLRVYRTW